MRSLRYDIKFSTWIFQKISRTISIDTICPWMEYQDYLGADHHTVNSVNKNLTKHQPNLSKSEQAKAFVRLWLPSFCTLLCRRPLSLTLMDLQSSG